MKRKLYSLIYNKKLSNFSAWDEELPMILKKSDKDIIADLKQHKPLSSLPPSRPPSLPPIPSSSPVINIIN